MRNSSSVRAHSVRRLAFGFVLAATLAISASTLPAQCDEGSLDCLPGQAGATTTGQDAAVFSISGSEQKLPQADASNAATAVASLSAGAGYTELSSLSAGGSGGRGAKLPVEPLTEFENFVSATTGQSLITFGEKYFTAQVSFGSLNNAPAPADLLLAADDELKIRIWGQVNFSANLRVGRDGEIYLPKVGALHVAGLTVAETKQHLREAMERIYRNFELTVDLGQVHSLQIYMTGMARQPGEYTVSALSTLVDAVFLSGGPSSSGSMRHVLLKRGGQVLTDFDLYELLVTGDKTGDRQLMAGDVLYIPATGPQVALIGSVRQPAIYELRGEETIEGLIACAGGRTALAAASHIMIDRIEDHARRSAFQIKHDAAGLSTRLVDGDIVRIDPITSNYRDTVTLRGAVANPGRFRWSIGMRLSDLIPDRDSLVTRGYWWHRTQLGFPAPEFTSAGSESALAGLTSNSESLGTNPLAAEMTAPNALSVPGQQTNWDYAVIERLDPATMTTSLLPFNLGKLVFEHDRAQDLAVQTGDVVTIFKQDEIHMPVDRKTKYVRLEGEVANAGVYSVAPGDTLRSLVARAGGLTTKAYLYGAEFTRESTRLLEEQRLDEYEQRLEHQLQRSAAKTPASGSAAAVQILMKQVRQLHATGRIVLPISPLSHSINDLPEIALEDGDKLLIPPRPATVQVIGAVFNQNAFICTEQANVGEYLKMAGGPVREADRRQIYVLRADGSVVHRPGSGTIFDVSNLNDVRMYPGDTVVVPEKSVRPKSMIGFMGWSQWASQMSLGAASASVLK
jgi:polysaccharide biosynthesis/export protein